jgi:hypothetical protein
MTSTCRRLRHGVLAVTIALLAAACGSTEPSGSSAGGTATAPEPAAGAPPDTVERIEPSEPDVTVSGLSIARGGRADGAPEPLIDLLQIIGGGPPPDGIPSIDEPVFLRTDAVDFLDDDEAVLAIDVDGDRRAYPVQILIWHEIVNDTVGGVPVAVTYCPLCNSAVAYDRRVDGRVMEFGTSGLLWNSALLMYDRQTETLWSHFTGQGVVGELTGVELDSLPVATVPWGVWRDAHPDGLVLSRATGFDRSYGQNPYPGYDDVTRRPFLFEGEVDGRYTAMTRIVGVEIDGDAVGVPLVTLRERQVVTTEIGDTELVVFWQAGTASALDADVVADGDDIGATGVFVPVVDGLVLTFSASDAGFVDDQTGSTWNLLGRAVDGPLTGTELDAVAHVDTFWFAWSTFRPDTVVIDG